MPYYSKETGHTLSYGGINTATEVVHVNKNAGDITGRFMMCFVNQGVSVIGQ